MDIAAGRAPGPLAINILVLSGGSQWGAYGSGFLNGLYAGAAAPQLANKPTEIRLSDYNIITGVSAGAMMAPYVWSAAIFDRAGDHGAAVKKLERLQESFSSKPDELFVARDPLLAVLGSNAVNDPRDLQDVSVRRQIDDLAPQLATDDGTGVLVGAVNLQDGMFYAFDLGEELKLSSSHRIDCLTQTLLASSAVPLVFPPRYIDNQPFIDGGLRFLAFVDYLMIGIRQAGIDAQVNVRVIINGNLSPNDPTVSGAAQAAACDNFDDVDHAKRCAPVANSLLGSFIPGSGAKGLIFRATQDVMLHQINISSIYRLYHDWRDLDLPGAFKYTYLSNKELASPPEPAKEPCVKWADSSRFASTSRKWSSPPANTSSPKPTFGACLWAIGLAEGAARHWTFTDTQPGADESSARTPRFQGAEMHGR